MTRKVYSQFNPPPNFGEVFWKPSLTDQLAAESLESIVKRFMASGYVPPASGDCDLQIANDTTVEDVDNVFADAGKEDVRSLDKVEQADVLATAARLVEQLRRKSAVKQVKEQEQPSPAPEPEKSQE